MDKCPTCGREDFESVTGMRRHHAMAHDERLPNTTCSRCSDRFYDGSGNRKHCEDCKYGTGDYTPKKEYAEDFDIPDEKLFICRSDDCERAFDSSFGRVQHEDKMHGCAFDPWRDESKLKHYYHNERMTMKEMAEMWDTSEQSILRQMWEHDIERRGAHPKRKQRAKFRTDKKGYECWFSSIPRENSTEDCKVHRLLAISEFGFEAVKDKIVHHKNGLSWDNRRENIELMTRSKHAKEHHKRGDIRK